MRRLTRERERALLEALEIYEPDLKPDFAAFTRLEFLDEELNTFR